MNRITKVSRIEAAMVMLEHEEKGFVVQIWNDGILVAEQSQNQLTIDQADQLRADAEQAAHLAAAMQHQSDELRAQVQAAKLNAASTLAALGFAKRRIAALKWTFDAVERWSSARGSRDEDLDSLITAMQATKKVLVEIEREIEL